MISKKKSSPKFRAFFCQLTPTSTSHFTIFGGAIFVWGGAISRFRAKTNLKTAKSMLFCILFRPMGGAIAPFAPPPLLRYWLERCALQSINFSHDVIKMRRSSHEKFGPFLKKIMIYYFYLSTIVSSSEGEGDPGQIANLFKAFLLDTALLRFSSYFCH